MDFLVNGYLMRASAIDANGTNYTNDFIGNNDGFSRMRLVEHEKYGLVYECDLDEFVFWSWACTTQMYITLKENEINERGVSITTELADAASSDLEDTLLNQLEVIKEKMAQLGIEE